MLCHQCLHRLLKSHEYAEVARLCKVCHWRALQQMCCTAALLFNNRLTVTALKRQGEPNFHVSGSCATLCSLVDHINNHMPQHILSLFLVRSHRTRNATWGNLDITRPKTQARHWHAIDSANFRPSETHSLQATNYQILSSDIQAMLAVHNWTAFIVQTIHREFCTDCSETVCKISVLTQHHSEFHSA